MIRVLIADDHAVVRKGIAQILSKDDYIFVAAEAASGREALRLLQESQVDVLILDLSMPEGGGLEVVSRALSLRPKTRVLILSMHSARQYVFRALGSGAAGYLTKESAPDELIAAVRRVAGGGRYVSQAVGNVLAEGLSAAPGQPLVERLSDREYQVLRMLADGKSPAEIASEFALSVKTVSTYRGRILEKLGLKNNAELVRFAVREGLAD